MKDKIFRWTTEFGSYAIQEKTWYGWRTLDRYSTKRGLNMAIKKLEAKGFIVL